MDVIGYTRGYESFICKSSFLHSSSKKTFAWEDRYIIHCSGASAMLTVKYAVKRLIMTTDHSEWFDNR